MEPATRIDLRPHRWGLVASLAAGIGLLVFGIRLAGPFDWLFLAMGALFIAASSYWLVRNKPRLSLSETGVDWGFEWSRRRLAWTEIASMRERRWGAWRWQRRRFCFLAVSVIGHSKGRRADRFLFSADFTVNIGGLEQPVDMVLELVEQLSGQPVERAH